MSDPGYSNEYTARETRKQNSMKVGESTAVGGTSPDDKGNINWEENQTIDQMLQQSAIGDDEEIEEEPERYDFTGEGVSVGTLGYTLVAKPDYDLS